MSPRKQGLKYSATQALLLTHLQTLVSSLGRMSKKPFAHLLTCAVIAIALALPGTLYVLLENTKNISGGWENSAQITVFLQKNISQQKIDSLKNRLSLHKQIDTIQIISKQQALDEFKQLSGFVNALDALDDNPLPDILIIQPIIDPNNPSNVDTLVQNLNERTEIDSVQLDMQWLQRFYGFLDLLQHLIIIIASLLTLAVLLIIGNTIRLDIGNRKEEIQVAQLIGATYAFIRRPFLYSGFWYGLIGGIMAISIIALSLQLLDSPVRELSQLYSNSFTLDGLSWQNSLDLLLLAISLGLLGSWLSVTHHLKQIEPK